MTDSPSIAEHIERHELDPARFANDKIEVQVGDRVWVVTGRGKGGHYETVTRTTKTVVETDSRQYLRGKRWPIDQMTSRRGHHVAHVVNADQVEANVNRELMRALQVEHARLQGALGARVEVVMQLGIDALRDAIEALAAVIAEHPTE